MRRTIILMTLAGLVVSGCNNSKNKKLTSDITTAACADDCKDKTSSTALTCKLTTHELQKRKETVLASLKTQMTGKKELKNGYAFRFPGTDEMVDELTEFIKTERVCCDFFTFNLSVSGDKSESWLELTGADGTKDFIMAELGL